MPRCRMIFAAPMITAGLLLTSGAQAQEGGGVQNSPVSPELASEDRDSQGELIGTRLGVPIRLHNRELAATIKQRLELIRGYASRCDRAGYDAASRELRELLAFTNVAAASRVELDLRPPDELADAQALSDLTDLDMLDVYPAFPAEPCSPPSARGSGGQAGLWAGLGGLFPLGGDDGRVTGTDQRSLTSTVPPPCGKALMPSTCASLPPSRAKKKPPRTKGCTLPSPADEASK